MISFLLAQMPEATGTAQPAASPTPTPTPAPVFALPTLEQATNFASTLVILLIIASIAYIVIFYGLRVFARRTEKQVLLLTLNVSQLPALITLVALCLRTAFYKLEATGSVDWIEKILLALLVAAGAFWISQIFTEVIAYYLKKYAQQSEATWDDVLVPILENTAPIIIYLIGAFLFIQSLGIDLTILSVVFGSLTVVLGFALQGILNNFFSGLVLLIDSPFQFGDVISLPDGSLAVIKKIGIRLTNLFLIDSNCEVFLPNGALQQQQILNLSRPAPHYYYSISLPLRADTAPSKAMRIIREVVMAHPDTLGSIDEKLQVFDKYYVFADNNEFVKHKQAKREAGQQRLLAEKNANDLVIQLQEALADLAGKINVLEKGGLELEETRKIQGYFLDILKLVGLELVKERQGKRRLSTLEESANLENTVIGEIRNWYKAWSKDPDLTEQDPVFLEEEWERKIQLLKFRMNKLFQKISQPSMDETRLDDYLLALGKWLNERFKNTQTLWQAPKIWTNAIRGDGTMASMEYVVKYFIDNIKLEQCQRGNRIKSEVQNELIRQLRQIYIYR